MDDWKELTEYCIFPVKHGIVLFLEMVHEVLYTLLSCHFTHVVQRELELEDFELFVRDGKLLLQTVNLFHIYLRLIIILFGRNLDWVWRFLLVLIALLLLLVLCLHTFDHLDVPPGGQIQDDLECFQEMAPFYNVFINLLHNILDIFLLFLRVWIHALSVKLVVA